MRASTPSFNARPWLDRWERQQDRMVHGREERFDTMLSAVETLVGRRFLAMDLASGPGSVSRRVLERFPRARTVAVDHDPLLLEIGRRALARFRGRLTWVDADLRSADWVEHLPVRRFDAILTTTALHWLRPPDLERVYRQCRGLLRAEGILLNGDSMEFAPGASRRIPPARREPPSRTSHSGRGPRAESWAAWWSRAAETPAFRELLKERGRRFSRQHHDHHYSADFHRRALRRAGFRWAETIWQSWTDRLILAIAP